jgi:NAD(P)-dependent dehydrogenase (short-subunit alcohol dehydrogenase family)
MASTRSALENVAQAVLYLVDNDFVTGACLRVDGGAHGLRRREMT